MIIETAPGVEESLALSPDTQQREIMPGREIAAPQSVKDAVASGSLESLEQAIVRETVGMLLDPYMDSFAAMGVMDISGRPTQGWAQGATDLDPTTRMREVSFARRLSVFAPPAKQAVRLHRCYVIGAGIPKPVALDSDVDEVISTFWSDPDNYELCTHIGQAETDQHQLIDGELFISFYVNKDDGHVKCRTVDPLDVLDVIPHPEDRKRILYYRVRRHSGQYDFESGMEMPDIHSNDWVFYRHWQNTDPSRDPYRGKAKPRAPEDACMGHWPLNRMGLRGVPDFCAGSVWIAQHKKFMENRAILQEALSKIAFVKTVKGGPAQIGASVGLEQSSLTQSLSRWERNPAPAPASTYVKNQGIDLEQMRVDTGASNAMQDGEQLAQMVGTAFGLPTHYIMMSTESSRLATAVAMELPVLKMYEDAQRRWLDMLRDIIDFVLLQAAKAPNGGLYVPVVIKHGREMIDWANAPPPPEATDTPQQAMVEQEMGGRMAMMNPPGVGGGSVFGGGQPPPGAAPPMQQAPVREQGAMMDPVQVTSQVDYMRQRESTNERENKDRGNYKIDMPPILERESASVVAAVVQAVQAGLITPEQGAYQVMTSLSFDDVSDSVKEWREWIEIHARHVQDQSEQASQQQQQAMDIQQQAATAKANGGQPGTAQPPQMTMPPTPQVPATTAGAGVPSGGMSGQPGPGANG